ncbi:MAG: hypothetical protein KKA61_04180 [Nanoarchaeota archaeon]|nr:hypothetical protein [Nanoarchaeota archaeon]MBU4284165.1 hypothetical protein [Nanoarchaeota archaeon]MBU4493543.1 hypothetical protein [Nanoarchaeota archaeon]
MRTYQKFSEHKNLVDYLTPKLKLVKDRLYTELSKGELKINEYWQKTYQFLCEEGIIKKSYDKWKTDFYDILLKLERKLPIKKYSGLKKRYMGLEDVALSTEAQEDCDKYTKLKGMTYNYLKKELGNKPVPYSEFKTMIKSYLMKQNELRGVIKPELLTIDLMFDLSREFNIGGYPPDVLEKALDNL